MGSNNIKKGNLNNFNNRLQSCSRHLKAFTFRFSSSIIVIVSNNNNSNLYMKRRTKRNENNTKKEEENPEIRSLFFSESNLSN